MGIDMMTKWMYNFVIITKFERRTMKILQRCACGCGRQIKWTGKGRKPLYASPTCRNRAYRVRLRRVLEAFKVGYAIKMDSAS